MSGGKLYLTLCTVVDWQLHDGALLNTNSHAFRFCERAVFSTSAHQFSSTEMTRYQFTGSISSKFRKLNLNLGNQGWRMVTARDEALSLAWPQKRNDVPARKWEHVELLYLDTYPTPLST